MNFTNNKNDSNNDGGVLYRDGGKTLMIKNNFLAPKGHWRRNNIFHSTYTNKDKVCCLIIDNRRCENVVSNKVIRKL